MSLDIRDRLICTAYSTVLSEKEIRSSMAIASEQMLRGCIVDMSTIVRMKSDASEHKNILLSINFPFSGSDQESCIDSINRASEYTNIKEIYVSFDKFLVQNSNLGEMRSFVKSANQKYSGSINFAVEHSWLKNKETLDKICSVLEPYERHGLAISTYCKRPEKLGEITSLGKYLMSNGSCKFSYFGALPANKDGIVEILSSGFSFCGIPKQFIGMVI